MGIKKSNHAALLEFTNIILLTGSNSDYDTSHSAWVAVLFYSRSFHTVSFGEKVLGPSASGDVVIP